MFEPSFLRMRMNIWVWQCYFYVFEKEENKEQHPRVDTNCLPCDSGLEVAGRVSGGGVGVEEATKLKSPHGITFPWSNLGTRML